MLSEVDAIILTKKTLKIKENISNVKYIGPRRTTWAIYEVPSNLIGNNIATSFLKYGEIVGNAYHNMHGKTSR